MDLNSLGVFKVMAKKMDWLTQRQAVIADNVANIDTPKFQSSDLTPMTFRSALATVHKLEPAMTSPAHQTLAKGNDGPGTVRRDRKPYETKPDGNAVVAEEQMLKLSQTSQDFNTVTSLYRRNVNLLKMAIGRGGN
jgi:flagellar basal-body rod protein FlgB